jgi:hypothetical protein
MNFIKTLLFSATLLGGSFLSANAAVMTDFGSSSYSITFADFTTNQTANSLHLTGDDFGSSIYGNLATPFDLGGSMDSLSLTASYSGPSTARFDVALFDADGDSLNFTGYFSSFTPGVTSTLTLNFGFAEGTFNGPVRTVAIIANGIGGANSGVDLTVYNLSAIPEPSTWALMLLGTTGVLIAIRRRKTA